MKVLIICLSPVKNLKIKKGNATTILFNREFYGKHIRCQEIACEGPILWGSSKLPVITLDDIQRSEFKNLIRALADELDKNDKIKGEMLRIPRKRLMIIYARMFATWYGINEESATGMAAGPLGCYLDQVSGIDRYEFLIHQGYHMDSPSPSLLTVKLFYNSNMKINSLIVGGSVYFEE